MHRTPPSPQIRLNLSKFNKNKFVSTFLDFAMVSLYRTSLSLGGLIPAPNPWIRRHATLRLHHPFTHEPTRNKVGATRPTHNPQLNISPEWLYLAVASTRAKALYVILFTCSLSFGPTGLRATGQKIWPVGPNPSSIYNVLLIYS